MSLAPIVGGMQPLPRLGFGPQRIYLVGGIEGNGELGTVWAYEPALDTWCEVASMATARCDHGAAALDGKLYVIGGNTDSGNTALDQAEVYDPKADSWQPLPSMPTARRSLAAAAVAGKVYAIGGLDDEFDVSDAVEAYDPISGAWTRVASLPVARSIHTATVVGGKIYVMGGNLGMSYNEDADEDADVATDRVDVYDPAADSWQQMAAMPTAKYSHAAAVLDGKICVSGGCLDSGERSDALKAYDPVANTWTKLAWLSQHRGDHASAVAHGRLYVFGGFSSRGRMDLVEVYSPASNSWAWQADLPYAIDAPVAVAL